MNNYQDIFNEMLHKTVESADCRLSKSELASCISSSASDFINETIPEIADTIVLSLNKESENHLKLIRDDADGFVDRNLRDGKAALML